MSISSKPVFDEKSLEAYIGKVYGGRVEIKNVCELRGTQVKGSIKEFGYGTPILFEFTCDGREKCAVLRTMSRDGFGHERASDRAANVLLDSLTFNKLPHHLKSIDTGAITKEKKLISLDEWDELFLLTEYASGEPYFRDLGRIMDKDTLERHDEQRVTQLADYLAKIHKQKNDDALLYRRRIRDLIGHGEGIMGMLDGYPQGFGIAGADGLEPIEHESVRWRWRIKDSTHRLSQVHGDFHPWNVLLGSNGDMTLLDRSRGQWGEPADDVSSMTINYLFFALRQQGKIGGPFSHLYGLFWDRYLDKTRDEEILDVIQPFYAWRALVLAHPLWYPRLKGRVREQLFDFIHNVLSEDRFKPERVGDYFEPKDRGRA